ncbi:hypothetical protein ABB37_01991 [Leptomonas pyrrhocoris]|uniref:Uncharacterized protein n=1 Tax=Leptomonas pyrrhocoris TaxID=157538 RepID=A0A0N0VGJ2_LEPPY|nr:hypothetical protein ABB37_01991 [Leptomonas pyrrhocoris]KPA83758.1 hypothetical protein ABB37_01991 [Leptomonas pyrrhocoris]|eukprot:XP_015662197.1 hypothetical protein ABB37_01991 [Leptomonas pyrrhocoris]
MFANIYDEEDSTTQRFAAPVKEGADADRPAGPRILVPDSDSDDSLGLVPLRSQTPTTAAAPVPRAFSKRASACAAELLRQHQKAASAVQRDNCMQQLRRLGGAYRPLGQGLAPTVWVRYADLNARVIQETETYFNGRLSDRSATPHVSRRNGSLSASTKPTVHVSNGAAAHELPCGVRSPLPFAVPKPTRTEVFTLSRGEQFALSLLSMEDGNDIEATRQPMPTYLLRKDANGELQRVSIASTAPSCSLGNTFGASVAPPYATTPLRHCWAYDDVEDGLSSAQTSPSAAHSTGSPAALSGSRKRNRDAEYATSLKRVRVASSAAACRLSFNASRSDSRSRSNERNDVEEDASVRSFSVDSSSFSAPKSLSATVIERQNHRVQWSLLRQQSLFSPF